MKNTPNMFRLTFKDKEGNLRFQDVVSLANVPIESNIEMVHRIFLEVADAPLTNAALIKQIRKDTVEELTNKLALAKKELAKDSDE